MRAASAAGRLYTRAPRNIERRANALIDLAIQRQHYAFGAAAHAHGAGRVVDALVASCRRWRRHLTVHHDAAVRRA
jgi:hypothetical protein